jgi:hypothetical protein
MTKDVGTAPDGLRDSSSPASDPVEARPEPAASRAAMDVAGGAAPHEATGRKKEVKALTPWQRYRALGDAFDMAQDLLEFGDRKVRFGLIVIGAINVVVLGGALKSGVAAALPKGWRPVAIVLAAAYAVALVKGVIHALSALRPRVAAPVETRGLHFYADVLRHELEEYDLRWRDLPVGELCTLMAREAYALAPINRDKFRALDRMYGATKGMLLLGSAILVLSAAVMLHGRGAGAPASAAGGGGDPVADSREYKLMLRPSRFLTAAGRVDEAHARAAITGFWQLASSTAVLDMRRLEAALETGPARRRLLQFFDADALPGEACQPAEVGAFLFDCKSLVLRSRLDVKPYDPAVGFEVEDASTLPLELTLKSRTTSSVVQAPEGRIGVLAAAGLEARHKIEKDMTVGRTTWSHSSSVRMTLARGREVFGGRAPHGPDVAVPADLAELQRLFTTAALQGAANRPLRIRPGQVAYEEAWVAADALELPGRFPATITMSLWHDVSGALRVVEASWRLQKSSGSGSILTAEVVGASEQLLDRLTYAAAREGWFDAEAALKKSQALTDASE